MEIRKTISKILLTLLLLQGIGHASESIILDAVNSNKITLGSKVALPRGVNAARALPGETTPAQQMLYAVTSAEVRTINNKAYPLMSAKWPFNVVFVCWEDPAAEHVEERRLVRSAVAETWEKYSGLEFIGWEKCTPNFRGVRIKVADDASLGAHVKYLGKYLAYDASGQSRTVNDGMVLNFTFQNWNTGCQNKREYCIRTIAVHEFGHAIGFAHEQNRPDTPNECTEAPQGTSGDTLLTPWDPHSVMNYCNERYNNDGELSEFDIKAVRYVYGAH